MTTVLGLFILEAPTSSCYSHLTAPSLCWLVAVPKAYYLYHELKYTYLRCWNNVGTRMPQDSISRAENEISPAANEMCGLRR